MGQKEGVRGNEQLIGKLAEGETVAWGWRQLLRHAGENVTYVGLREWSALQWQQMKHVPKRFGG